MLAQSLLLVPALASLASAHFQIDFPYWRDNSFNAPYSQYTYPCAGVNQSVSANNRTLWGVTGTNYMELDLHHAWTYVAINMALGNTVTSFNISLTPTLTNATGNGTLCYPINLPASVRVQEGTNASLQVVTFGQSGSALYNCADITFSAAAVLPGDKCKTNGVTVAQVFAASSGSGTGTGTTGGAAASTSSAAAASTSKSAAGRSVEGAAVGLVAVLAVGVSALL